MFCQECPQKAYCSDFCPEARAYANQDCLTRRETCEILGISRQNLRNVLLRIKRKGYVFAPNPD